MRYWLVMPAAGVGRRFGESIPKQYADLQGRTVIEWSLAPFIYDSRCAGIMVVLGATDQYWAHVAVRLPELSVSKASDAGIAAALAAVEGVPEATLESTEAVTLPAVMTTHGGADRSRSVRNGLAALARRAAADDWVLVHDAARPCLARQDVDRLLQIGGAHRIGGILAAPAADTLKRVAALEILETVDRSALWRAQTPQMFRFAPLCAALDAAFAAGRAPTDESQALEWLGATPQVVQGSSTNIKITSVDDLAIAAALLAAHAGHARSDAGPEDDPQCE